MHLSVRARAVLGSVGVVAVALLIGSVAMVLLLRSSLTSNVREAVELRAEDVATALEVGGVSSTDLTVEDDEDALIQVIGAGGEVLASSANVAGLAAVAELSDEESAILDDPPVGQDRFVAVGVGAQTDDGEVTVVVARALDDAEQATWTLIAVLAVGVPVLLGLVGVLAWQVVGRALRPVAAMSTVAEEITATDLDRRLPEPDGKDEIAHLGVTLNAMLGRLADSRDRMAAFVADAAHELRSPISSVRQHAEVALEHPDAVAVDELAEVVRTESLRLQGLVDDLLLLARNDENTPDTFVPVDLDAVVGAVASRLRPVAEATIDLSGTSGGQVRGDPIGLDRLVGNLMDNAVRHATTRVVVTLTEDQSEAVTLVVDDDGPGIPPEERVRVFERFVRLDEARSRDAGGSGLGLAIVAAVAATHDATVTVGANADGGARFTVHFPPA